MNNKQVLDEEDEVLVLVLCSFAEPSDRTCIEQIEQNTYQTQNSYEMVIRACDYRIPRMSNRNRQNTRARCLSKSKSNALTRVYFVLNFKIYGKFALIAIHLCYLCIQKGRSDERPSQRLMSAYGWQCQMAHTNFQIWQWTKNKNEEKPSSSAAAYHFDSIRTAVSDACVVVVVVGIVGIS